MVQQLFFQNIIDLHRHEPKTVPELLCAIDRDETCRRVMLGDGYELVDALPRKVTPLELGQNYEIVDVVLVSVGGYFPEQAIRSRRLEIFDGMAWSATGARRLMSLMDKPRQDALN